MATTTSKSKRIQKTTVNENQNNYNYSSAPIPETPFTMFYEEERGYCATLGNSAITEWNKSEKEILKQIPKTNWKTMTSIISAIASNVYDIKTEMRIQDAIKQGGN